MGLLSSNFPAASNVCLGSELKFLWPTVQLQGVCEAGSRWMTCSNLPDTQHFAESEGCVTLLPRIHHVYLWPLSDVYGEGFRGLIIDASPRGSTASSSIHECQVAIYDWRALLGERYRFGELININRILKTVLAYKLIPASLGFALQIVLAKMGKRQQHVRKLLYPVVLSKTEELAWTTYFVQPWKEGFETVSKGNCAIYICSIDIHTCVLIVMKKHACCVCCCGCICFAGATLEFLCDETSGCDTPFTTFWRMFDAHHMISCGLVCGKVTNYCWFSNLKTILSTSWGFDKMKSTWNPRWCCIWCPLWVFLNWLHGSKPFISQLYECISWTDVETAEAYPVPALMCFHCLNLRTGFTSWDMKLFVSWGFSEWPLI